MSKRKQKLPKQPLRHQEKFKAFLKDKPGRRQTFGKHGFLLTQPIYITDTDLKL